MIKFAFLSLIFASAVFSCPTACTPDIVSATQHTNGVCDPQCNSGSCGFEDECLAQCLESGCPLRLLGNGQCDEKCAGALCAFDRGDCGFCADGCFAYMLQNDLCEEACFTPACDFDLCNDCAPDCFAQQVYVFENSALGSGTIDFPYSSIDVAFANVLQPTAIYLLGPRISIWESHRLEGSVYIQSLPCFDYLSTFCSGDLAAIDVKRSAILTVVSSVTFARVRLTSEGAFENIKFCPQLAFADGAWTRVNGEEASEEEVTAASICEEFKFASLFRVTGNLTFSVRLTQAVTIDSLTVQPLALISIDGGHVLFEEVNILNFHTQRNGGDSALILSTATVIGGSFRFLSGSVDFLNLGVSYSNGLILAPFLLSTNIETVEIRAVTFHCNLVVEAYSSFLDQSKSALMYLQNFYRLIVVDCNFKNNFISGGLIVVDTGVKLPIESLDNSEGVAENHILLSSLNFSVNLAEHCLISIKMKGDNLNIKIHNINFTRNAIEAENLLSFISAADIESSLSRFDFQEVTISENFAANQLIYISHLANVQFSSLSITDNGDFDPEVLPRIYGEFAAATNSTSTPLFPAAPQCASFILIETCTRVSARNVSFEHNYCSFGVCGFELLGISDMVSIMNFTSEFNDCKSQKAVAMYCNSVSKSFLERVYFRDNISFETVMMVFEIESHVEISDSVCERNLGVYGTCAYFFQISTIKLTRFYVIENQSIDSYGGGFAMWAGEGLPIHFILSDCVFQGNSASKGGAISVEIFRTTSILLEMWNTVFIGNSADLAGAVLFMTMQTVFPEGSMIHNCTFLDNHSVYGIMLIMHAGGSLRISNSIFKHNYGAAAAVLMIETNAEAITLVENNIFEDNLDGPVILKANSHVNSSLITRNCTFLNNPMGSVALEGGIWQDSSSLFSSSTASQILLSSSAIADLTSAVISGNKVAKSGGAVHAMSESIFRCFDCEFVNNSAGYAGAAIFVEQDGSVLLDNCQFTNNTAITGGAALFISNSMSAVSLIKSTVIENNYGGNFGVIFAEAAIFQLVNITLRENIGEGCPGITQLMSHSTITSSAFLSMRGSQAAFLSLYASSTASIADSYFSDGFVDNGGAIYLSSLSNATVSYSAFMHIVCLQGGVFTALSSSTVSLYGVTVKEIESKASGSVLYLYDSSLFIFKSTFRRFRSTGIYGNQLDEVAIFESIFEAGEGELGGAVFFYECLQVSISNTSFSQLTGHTGGALHFTSTEPIASGKVIISQSNFRENEAEKGGAIYCVNYFLTIENSVFSDNSAAEGGAMSLDCTNPELCAYSISSSQFLRNSASIKGGAISWSSCKPSTSSTIFNDNTALYGPDFASFPIELEYEDTDPLTVAPGQETTATVVVSLLDHYGQRISIDNSSTAEIGPSTEGYTVSGETRTTADRGVFVFDRYIVYAEPNSSVELVIETAAITTGQAGDPDPHNSVLNISLEVRDCEVGEYRHSDRCEVCTAGTCSLDPSTPCETCPRNAQCLGNFTVTPNSGYWRSGQVSPAVRACPNAGACLGGIVEGKPLSLTGYCATGYKGNLCQSCDTHYSRTAKNKCEKCPEKHDNIIRLAFIIFCVCIAVVIIVWTTLRSASRPSATHSILIRIFVNYLQLVLLVSDFKLHWPNEVLRLFQMQEALGGIVDQVYSVDCFLNNQRNTAEGFFRKTMLMAVLPVPLVGVSTLFWMCAAAHKRTWRVMRQECVATVIILYFLVLPSLVKSLFSMFSCSEIEAGEYWLAVDLDIKCWNSMHIFYALTVGLPGLLVWVLSVPLLCLLAVIRSRKRLGEVAVRLRYSFIISGYRLRFYYWEFVILYRKVAIICISVFISTSVPVQALTVQFVLVVALFLQYRVQPFAESFLNAVELRSVVVADVTIFCGLYYLTNATSGATSLFLFIAIVRINVAFVVYWLFALLLHVRHFCIRRSVLCRRVLKPGVYRDEELEAFLTEFLGTHKHTNASSMQHCFRLMLWNRTNNSPNVSSFLSKDSSMSGLIEYI